MNDFIITFNGHTNPALLALEVLERLRGGEIGTSINEESFRYVATLIPDFRDTAIVSDIDTIEDLNAFAFEYGFLIRKIGSSIEALTNEMRHAQAAPNDVSPSG